ncbi:hypothetical protein HK405_004151, partial [Cladochytrium tenue]
MATRAREGEEENEEDLWRRHSHRPLHEPHVVAPTTTVPASIASSSSSSGSSSSIDTDRLATSHRGTATTVLASTSRGSSTGSSSSSRSLRTPAIAPASRASLWPPQPPVPTTTPKTSSESSAGTNRSGGGGVRGNDAAEIATFTLTDPHVHLPPYQASKDAEAGEYTFAVVSGAVEVRLPVVPPHGALQAYNATDGAGGGGGGGRQRRAATPTPAAAQLLRAGSIGVRVVGTQGGREFFVSKLETVWELRPEVHFPTASWQDDRWKDDVDELERRRVPQRQAELDHIAANADVLDNNLLLVKALDANLQTVSFPFLLEIPSSLPNSGGDGGREESSSAANGRDLSDLITSLLRNKKRGEIPPFPIYEIQCVISFVDPSLPFSVSAPVFQAAVSKRLQVRRTVPSSWVDRVMTCTPGTLDFGLRFEAYHSQIVPVAEGDGASPGMVVHLKVFSDPPSEAFEVLSVDVTPTARFRTNSSDRRDNAITTIVYPTAHGEFVESFRHCHHLNLHIPFAPRFPDTETADWELQHWIEIILRHRPSTSLPSAAPREARFAFRVEAAHAWRGGGGGGGGSGDAGADAGCDVELREQFAFIPLPRRLRERQREVPAAFGTDATPPAVAPRLGTGEHAPRAEAAEGEGAASAAGGWLRRARRAASSRDLRDPVDAPAAASATTAAAQRSRAISSSQRSEKFLSVPDAWKGEAGGSFAAQEEKQKPKGFSVGTELATSAAAAAEPSFASPGGSVGGKLGELLPPWARRFSAQATAAARRPWATATPQPVAGVPVATRAGSARSSSRTSFESSELTSPSPLYVQGSSVADLDASWTDGPGGAGGGGGGQWALAEHALAAEAGHFWSPWAGDGGTWEGGAMAPGASSMWQAAVPAAAGGGSELGGAAEAAAAGYQ